MDNNNININIKSNMSGFLSEFEPSTIVNKDGSGVECYHCGKESWILFNKNNNLYDYENEYCWDCLRKQIKHNKLEVKINGR